MKLKKFFALALAAATLALALTACGSKADDSAHTREANPENQPGEPVTVKRGGGGGIYHHVWGRATAARADEGIDLEIVQFSDYVTPNNALANGDIDLNAFQHRIYLQNEIDNYGYAIQNIGNTFIIPLNLYSQKVSSVDELKDGDVVAIPDDLTNGGRALKVLEAAGLIELDPNAAFNPTVDDITSYKVNITIEELKANTIPSVLPDVAAAVVNGNYALDFGLKTDEAIYKDSVLDVEDYWNLIAARTADVEDPDTAAIYEKVVEAFQSSATEDVFNNTCGVYFIAVGWYPDLINLKTPSPPRRAPEPPGARAAVRLSGRNLLWHLIFPRCSASLQTKTACSPARTFPQNTRATCSAASTAAPRRSPFPYPPRR